MLLVVAWASVGARRESLADPYPPADPTARPAPPVLPRLPEQTPRPPASVGAPRAGFASLPLPAAEGDAPSAVDGPATPMGVPPTPAPTPVPTLPPAPPPTPPPPSPAPATSHTDSSLTWFGVTLYGVLDVGVAHLTHGAPLSKTYGPGLPYMVQNYSNRSITSVAGNGLSQSKIGLAGSEPLGARDLRAVFRLETGFQPTSGRLTDGPRSLIDNNGRANGDKVTAGDSARAGQPFQGAAYGGLASTMLGTLTVGRQPSLMADDLMKYDPQLQSQAFSPIGYSGTSGGLGATEDKILDQAVKYVLGLGPVRLAGLYQFGSSGRVPGGSQSVDLGIDCAGLSLDLLWGRVHGAVSAASLTAAQNASAPGTLAATVSDNTAYAFMLRYAVAWLKIYGGYQHITYANPKDPLANGTEALGGYVLSNVNNAAFTIHKVLQYAWTGVRVSLTPSLEVSAAYYHFRQNSTNANGCSDDSAASCSGSYHDASFVVTGKLTPRLDLYAGVNYSRAVDGMAAGFLNDRNWTTMTGLRISF
jgi:predicted porin